MTRPQRLAFLGCRLLSLYVLYQALRHIGVTVTAVFQGLRTDAFEGMPGWLDLISPSLSILLFDLLASGLLWFAADWISRRMVADDGDPEATGPSTWSPSDVLSVAIVVLGAIILVHSIPSVINLLYFAAVHGVSNQPSLLSTLAVAAIGVWFVFGSRSIAGFVGKVRRW